MRRRSSVTSKPWAGTRTTRWVASPGSQHVCGCAATELARLPVTLVQVAEWGDLSHLLRDAYAEDIRHMLATAQPWDLSLAAIRRQGKPQPGAVYHVFYTIEQYMRLALRLKLWPYPRGHFQHIASIPWM